LRIGTLRLHRSDARARPDGEKILIRADWSGMTLS
jgi:hypothetical protein